VDREQPVRPKPPAKELQGPTLPIPREREQTRTDKGPLVCRSMNFCLVDSAIENVVAYILVEWEGSLSWLLVGSCNEIAKKAKNTRVLLTTAFCHSTRNVVAGRTRDSSIGIGRGADRDATKSPGRCRVGWRREIPPIPHFSPAFVVKQCSWLCSLQGLRSRTPKRAESPYLMSGGVRRSVAERQTGTKTMLQQMVSMKCGLAFIRRS